MPRKAGKNVSKARAAVEARSYTPAEAVTLLQKVKFAKFDETVDLTMRLGVDPKHADQMVRGAIVLPHGTGKTMRVAVIAKGSGAPNKDKVGKVTEKQVAEIAKQKMPDLNAASLDAAIKSVKGTARSMGIEVVA